MWEEWEGNEERRADFIGIGQWARYIALDGPPVSDVDSYVYQLHFARTHGNVPCLLSGVLPSPSP